MIMLLYYYIIICYNIVTYVTADIHGVPVNGIVYAINDTDMNEYEYE